ncbi:30S ribosomal protein S4 [Candidatus Bathyarchaeota archaeon]|nr:30S ribosomal protein S4 [Candidatus Bathyarchaeota archaeon]
MGDPRKQKKKYDSPRNPWGQEQISAELQLIGEYGLRNKKELLKARTALSRIRGIARSLLGKEESERVKLENEFLQSLSRKGILPENANIDDVLDLDIKDILERRLQTLTFRKGLAKTIHQARQLISHGHIRIGKSAVSIPSYMVARKDDQHIKITPELKEKINPTMKDQEVKIDKAAPKPRK